jgi:rare lipoprotein A
VPISTGVSRGGSVALTAALLLAAASPTATAAPSAPSAGAGPGTFVTAVTEPPEVLAPRDLDDLRTRVSEATAAADRHAADLLAAAGRTASLRVAMDRVSEEQETARAALDRRVREVYMAAVPDPMRALSVALSPEATRLLAEGAEGGLRVDQALVDAVADESAEVAALRAEAEAARAGLLAGADAVYTAQDEARTLLAQAEAAYAEQQRRAADERARAAVAEALRALQAQRAQLAEQSAAVSFTVAPAVTARGRRAGAAQEPVVALLERTQRASPGALPPGFRATGQVLVGDASWYGPGFVGKPTASGSPYDPERLTAAMKAVPLGTVVRVSRADGRAVSVLITDRGPYAGDRILDVSQAAMRELGRFGVGQVRIEVLARG